MTSCFEIMFWDEFRDIKREEGFFFGSLPFSATESFIQSTHISEPQSVGSLQRSIYLHYFSIRTTTGPSHCLVTRIRIYKQRGALQHESVLVSFKLQADDEPEQHLLVERNVNMISLFGYLSSSQSPKLAADTAHLISTVEPPNIYGEAVWSLTMPDPAHGPTINLVQMSTILSVVSRLDKNYDLTKSNRYWFARTIRETLSRIIQESNNSNGDQPVEEYFGRLLFHMGHFGGFFCMDGQNHAQARTIIDDAYRNYKNLYEEDFLPSWHIRQAGVMISP